MSEFVSELSALMKKHKAFFYIYPTSNSTIFKTEYMFSINVREAGFPDEDYEDGNNVELLEFVVPDDFITPEMLCDVSTCAEVLLKQEEI